MPDHAPPPDPTPPDVPGRVLLKDVARSLAKLSARELAALRVPYLLLLGDGVAGNMGMTTSAFQTRSPDAPPGSEGPSAAQFAYTVAKRPGANAFGHMITLGRAKNNDLVVPDSAVSKFHASFTQAPDGSWLLTDASTNGTWIDSARLTPGRAAPVRSGATISLAQWARLIFLAPPDLGAYLGTGLGPR